MSIRFIIILITVLICVNIYYDNVFVLKFNKYKKYYKMGGVILFAFGMLSIQSKNPNSSINTLKTMNEFVNVMPIDKNSKELFAPFFERSYQPNMDNYNYSSNNVPKNSISRLHGKTKKTKRSVSETKKKYVASLQNWHCKHCQKQLTAWFEVDHIKELENGGSNDVENLQALCRECHAKKGSIKNLI